MADGFKAAQWAYDRQEPDWEEAPEPNVPLCCFDCRNRYGEFCAVGVIMPLKKQTCARMENEETARINQMYSDLFYEFWNLNMDETEFSRKHALITDFKLGTITLKQLEEEWTKMN